MYIIGEAKLKGVWRCDTVWGMLWINGDGGDGRKLNEVERVGEKEGGVWPKRVCEMIEALHSGGHNAIQFMQKDSCYRSIR